MKFAGKYCRDAALVEVVLREAKSIVRMGNGNLITETRQGTRSLTDPACWKKETWLYSKEIQGKSTELIRPREKDLFM